MGCWGLLVLPLVGLVGVRLARAWYICVRMYANRGMPPARHVLYTRDGRRACVRSGTPSHSAVQACNTMYCQRQHTDTLRSYATGWEGRPLVKTYYTMALPCS